MRAFSNFFKEKPTFVCPLTRWKFAKLWYASGLEGSELIAASIALKQSLSAFSKSLNIR